MNPTISTVESLIRSATHVKIDYPGFSSDRLAELAGNHGSLDRPGDEAAFVYHYEPSEDYRRIPICDLLRSEIEENSLVLPLDGRKLTFFRQHFEPVRISSLLT